MKTADQVGVRPRPVWIVAALAWVGLAGTFAPALSAGRDWPAELTIGTLAVFGLVYLAGVAAWVLPRPVQLVTLRLGGLLLAQAGIVLLALGTAQLALRLSAAAAGVYTLALCMSRSVGDRMVDGGSYPGERRFAFRAPSEAGAGIFIACLVPSIALWALVVALAAESAGLRWAGAAVALVFAGLGWFTARRLVLLARRWFVFAPRTVAIVEPYLLADTMAVPLPRILDISQVVGEADGSILDLRSGTGGAWIQLLWDEEVDVPGPRRLPDPISRLRPDLAKRAIGVAAPLSTPEIFVAVAAALDIPTGGSYLDTT